MGVLLLQHWPYVPVVSDKVHDLKVRSLIVMTTGCGQRGQWAGTGRAVWCGCVWYVVPGNLALSITINNITT